MLPVFMINTLTMCVLLCRLSAIPSSALTTSQLLCLSLPRSLFQKHILLWASLRLSWLHPRNPPASLNGHLLSHPPLWSSPHPWSLLQLWNGCSDRKLLRPMRRQDPLLPLLYPHNVPGLQTTLFSTRHLNLLGAVLACFTAIGRLGSIKVGVLWLPCRLHSRAADFQ